MQIKVEKVEFLNPIHIFGGTVTSLGSKPLQVSGQHRDINFDVDLNVITIATDKHLRLVPMSNVRCFDIEKPLPVSPGVVQKK